MGLLAKLGETSFRTLKYGKDTPGGGSSGQPYIVAPIPDEIDTSGPLDKDFILRGGSLAFKNSAEDISRLTKMFTDPKSFNGAGFIIKQNLLALSGVRTQASNLPGGFITGYSLINDGLYSPVNTLAQAGVNALGGHLNKQGFLGGIESLFGLGQGYSANLNSIKDDTSNRLVGLYSNKIVGNSLSLSYNTGGNSIATDPNYILSYTGGPNSILGIGRTRIKFADKRTVTLLKDSNPSLLNVKQIQDASELNKDGRSDKNNYSPKIQDFRKILRNTLSPANDSTIIANAPDYNIANIENRVNLGNPGTKGNIYSYTKGKILPGDSTSKALDKITAKPLYLSGLVDPTETNDLVKFRIEALDNDNPNQSVFMHFRAFLDQFSDNYSATWNSSRFIGRGEEFYTYNGFTRTISMGWTMAAQSKDELIPMYQKLNYLASNMMPDYSKLGYMRGPLMLMTVGGYLYSQPGFMTSLTYSIPDNSPWEIGINDTINTGAQTTEEIKGISDNSVKELSHIMTVTMGFTPIHRFIPRKQTNKYLGETAGDGKYISEWGPEHFVALSTGGHNNYSKTPNYTK
jgi:hypothetical protein